MASPAARNASADVAARQSIRPAMPHMVTLQAEAFDGARMKAVEQ
jgi:hypothetical protein